MDEPANGANSAEPTIGVEEEFLLVEAGTGRLAAQGPEVLELAHVKDEELQKELARCQLELATPICRNAEEVLGQLRKLRAQLADAARRRGLWLLSTGTAVLAEDTPPPLSPGARYHRMAEQFGELVDTSTICGCHVHVAIPDRETGIGVSNHVRPWLPVLLALSANSPFDQGRDSGYASWRYLLWSRWPSAGPPPFFESLDHYESSLQAMLRSEAVLDRGMIYWDIRLSEKHPTLEMRVCDVAPTVRDAALLAVLTRGLVSMALRDLAQGMAARELPQEVLRAGLWRAARDGLEGRCPDPDGDGVLPVHTLLHRLAERIRPVLADTGEDEFVAAELRRLCEQGSGSNRQRQAFARRGRLDDVVELLAQQTVQG